MWTPLHKVVELQAMGEKMTDARITRALNNAENIKDNLMLLTNELDALKNSSTDLAEENERLCAKIKGLEQGDTV